MKKEITAEEYLQRILSSKPMNDCPMRKTLELISGKWRTHIIYELCKKQTCRFGELKKRIPQITNTMLTSTLRDLEKYGIVYREQFNEIPPHVEYSLTDKGKALLPTFLNLQNGAKHIYMNKIHAEPKFLNCSGDIPTYFINDR